MAEDDAVFQEAVEALREGKKARARELLTGLLKTDQNNATYWVWMSAAMETPKERIYCLQTALKLDPENAAAKRGLRLFWFGTGKDDGLIGTTRNTVDLFKKHGFTPVFLETEGAHTWLVWRDYLSQFAPQLFQH